MLQSFCDTNSLFFCACLCSEEEEEEEKAGDEEQFDVCDIEATAEQALGQLPQANAEQMSFSATS